MDNKENLFDENMAERNKKTATSGKGVQKKRKRRKSNLFSKLTAGFLVMLAVAVAAGAIALFQMWSEYSHTEKDMPENAKSITVTIPQGASGATIAEILKESGVINNELAFRWKLKKSPYKNDLNYGKFELKEYMPYNDIIEALRIPSEHKKGITVTIPEGYSVEMIAQLFEDKGLVTKDEFLKELEEGTFEYDFIKDIPASPGRKYKLQGYLFPSTHAFSEDADAHEIIDTLLGEFERQYYGILGNQAAPIPMNDAIIIASLIEREAKLDPEREIISGVIQNRLNINMSLKIDATVIYAVSDGLYDMDRVLYSDLEVDSPYNTYKVSGLPAGAICNPGIESIIAAMYPQSHNYLYYHTDTEKNDGSHIFTETFSQHTSTMG